MGGVRKVKFMWQRAAQLTLHITIEVVKRQRSYSWQYASYPLFHFFSADNTPVIVKCGNVLSLLPSILVFIWGSTRRKFTIKRRLKTQWSKFNGKKRTRRRKRRCLRLIARFLLSYLAKWTTLDKKKMEIFRKSIKIVL